MKAVISMEKRSRKKKKVAAREKPLKQEIKSTVSQGLKVGSIFFLLYIGNTRIVE